MDDDCTPPGRVDGGRRAKETASCTAVQPGRETVRQSVGVLTTDGAAR